MEATVYRRFGRRLIRGKCIGLIGDDCALFRRDANGPSPAKPITIKRDKLLEPTAELDAEYKMQHSYPYSV